MHLILGVTISVEGKQMHWENKRITTQFPVKCTSQHYLFFALLKCFTASPTLSEGHAFIT